MLRQVFWSGGIGDIIALESTFTDEYRLSVVRMYWATKAKDQMCRLFTRFPSFPNLKDHVSLIDAFPDGYACHDFEQACNDTLRPHLIVGPIEDWSVSKRFRDPQPFTYSSFVKFKLASMSNFCLPDRYTVICPYSTVTTREVQEWRMFKDDDWGWLIARLEADDAQGVVLNIGDDPVPKHNRLIDLSNKTTLAEAMEITKKASAYIGIDSAFAVLAAKVPVEEMVVRAVCVEPWIWKHVYYAPRTDFEFVVPSLGASEKEKQTWQENARLWTREWMNQ